MKLLVTGGAGFIGSNFILYWMQRYPEDSVVNFDALTYAGNLENLKNVEKNPHYRFIHGDIRDPGAVHDAMRGIEIVVHFAAESHVDRSILEPSPFITTNIVGTYTILEQALKAKIQRFHHVSTDEVYGSLDLDDPGKFNERTPYNPRSPYSASKASSDHLVNSYYHTYGLPITITNCSNNYGPFQFPEKLIALTITNLLEGKDVPVYGDGRHVRDWLYVEDHCRAIDTVLRKGSVGETYCIGGLTDDIDNLTVINKILRIMGEPESKITFTRERPGHDRRYALDWSKIRNDLHWTPLHDFDAWLGKTIAWYRENREWWMRVKSGTYQSYYEAQYGAKT